MPDPVVRDLQHAGCGADIACRATPTQGVYYKLINLNDAKLKKSVLPGGRIELIDEVVLRERAPRAAPPQ